jgi:hypothetical protein
MAANRNLMTILVGVSHIDFKRKPALKWFRRGRYYSTGGQKEIPRKIFLLFVKERQK